MGYSTGTGTTICTILTSSHHHPLTIRIMYRTTTSRAQCRIPSTCSSTSRLHHNTTRSRLPTSIPSLPISQAHLQTPDKTVQLQLAMAKNAGFTSAAQYSSDAMVRAKASETAGLQFQLDRAERKTAGARKRQQLQPGMAPSHPQMQQMPPQSNNYYPPPSPHMMGRPLW